MALSRLTIRARTIPKVSIQRLSLAADRNVFCGLFATVNPGIGYYKSEDTMKVVRIDEVSKEAYLNPLFTGPEVARQVLLPDSQENVVNVIHFGKGVRNKFHTHDCEQILIITAGRGVVATEQEERVVTVGDIVLIPAGEKHWHGSNGESDFPTFSFRGREAK